MSGAPSAAHRLSTLLAEHYVLGLAGQEAADWLSRIFEFVSLRTGETLYAEGEPGCFAYLICRGRVRVVRNSATVALSLGLFGPGSFFGGHTVESHWQRTTSCWAIEDVELFRLPRKAFDELLNAQPQLSTYFDKSDEEAVLLETLGLSKLLAAVRAEQLMVTIDAFGEASYSRGEVVVREGDPAETMFVVRSGRLEVHRKLAFAERRLCDLQRGDFFGERALVLDQPRAATVTVAEDCTVFTLDRAGLTRLTQIAPSLSQQLHAKFEDYARVTATAVQAHDVILVPMHRDQIPLTADDVRVLSAVPAWIEQDALLKLLRLSDFVRGIPPDSIAIIVAALTERQFQRGDVLPEDLLFVVHSGEIHAHPAVQEGDRPVARFGPGRTCGARRRLAGTDPWQYRAAVDTDGFTLDNEAMLRLGIRLPCWEPHLWRLAALEGVTEAVETPQLPQTNETSTKSPPEAVRSRRSGRRPRSDHVRQARYPWIAQRAENECAVAALAMVARWHGLSASYDDVRNLIEVLPFGISLLEIRQAAQSLGFDAELAANVTSLSAVSLPAVAHWQDSHYVVLFRVGPRSVTLGDPALGLVQMPRRSFDANWSGRLLTLTPHTPSRPNELQSEKTSLPTS